MKSTEKLPFDQSYKTDERTDRVFADKNSGYGMKKIWDDHFLACILVENVKVGVHAVSFLCFPPCCMQESHRPKFFSSHILCPQTL